jgi:hypothetical protein
VFKTREKINIRKIFSRILQYRSIYGICEIFSGG